jgi:hypothetical protein
MTDPPAGWYDDPIPGVDGLRFWDGAKWTDQVDRPDIEPAQQPQGRQLQQTESCQGTKADILKRRAYVSLLILIAWWIVGQVIVHFVATDRSKGELVLYLILYVIEVVLVVTSIFSWWRYLQERRR